jgi:hypothetical protein
MKKILKTMIKRTQNNQKQMTKFKKNFSNHKMLDVSLYVLHECVCVRHIYLTMLKLFRE